MTQASVVTAGTLSSRVLTWRSCERRRAALMPAISSKAATGAKASSSSCVMPSTVPDSPPPSQSSTWGQAIQVSSARVRPAASDQPCSSRTNRSRSCPPARRSRTSTGISTTDSAPTMVTGSQVAMVMVNW
ncbi:Uncharacterised protein [Bordetella pertussis]|nr:Uncharacterised protein [Bordetella pertussis]CFL92789.1 Uncharacterised protein [Bordetella pertussis]CFM37715.1 Uncharacterised protein [Bordetella pertussis]CFM56291.1 Uncharacterised protein [Bordetella pertussis]CFM93154.1 Uncharacterised protein [Bordetella pertussis]